MRRERGGERERERGREKERLTDVTDLLSLTFWPYGLGTCGLNPGEYIP